MTRTMSPSAIRDQGAVAVLRAAAAFDYLPVCRTLADAGLEALELTLTTPGTIDALPQLRAEVPNATFGVGTVTSVAEVQAAVRAGAAFIVTPITDVTIIDAATSVNCPIVVGAFSPTEVWRAWDAGATAVKLFPAANLGPSYIAQLRGPFPDLEVMPSGGVGIDDIPAWIGAGAGSVSLGGPLLGDAFRGGDLDALRDRALRTLEAVRSARERVPR
jgi:2-dehydro-3-deoxyphosphogluconate aldolase/(4S)-4-hydroxy-2-oxoglutarate aldolase